ncbi:NAD(P)H dehydrogenase (quinone) [Euphorbia peplus]|nr:NAD(P)H dehydrogenase (quinone) [Euphorbia peplus]
MGKGGGCVPSKKKLPVNDQDPPLPSSTSPVAREITTTITQINETPTQIVQNQRIFIIFYSMYGHVEVLARRMKKGVDSIDGVEGVLYRVPETLPVDVLEQMRVPKKENGNEGVVPVVSVDELVNADGFLFGFPTRFGSMAAQMKAFFDSTDELWIDQKLAGVPAGFFVSTGTQGGGQETTAWTAITQLAHHGMLYVPIGYTFGAGMFRIDSIRGGSPYGAGVFSGDGSRQPTDTELALAEHQGKYMATVVKRFAKPPSSLHGNNHS